MSPTRPTDLRFRAAAHADHVIANEIWNRTFPDEAHGPEGMAYEWTITEPGWHIARFVIEKRRSRSWELDLVANRDRLLAGQTATRLRMGEAGTTLTTWDRIADPDKLAKLHAVVEESLQDIPTTAPHVPDSLDTFRQWIEGSPGLRPDRIWIALRGALVVGVSMLEYPVSHGNVWTDYTGTARSVRGRGIARALKYETVAQAIALGQQRVRTNNDAENAPILKLNAEMGYTRIPGWIQLHRAAGEA